MDVRLSEVIGALSHALDITEGQPRGHAERSCLIGMRLAEVAANHHERLDGRGYGRGLTAQELDVPSRLLAVADVAEALTAARPYRGPLSADEALAIMRRDAGTALDAGAFAACEAWLPMRALEAAEARFTKDAPGVPEPAPLAPPAR